MYADDAQDSDLCKSKWGLFRLVRRVPYLIAHSARIGRPNNKNIQKYDRNALHASAYALSLELGCLGRPYSIGNFTQISWNPILDYLDYEYPNPIFFEYPGQDYRQPAPYIVDFPENRGAGQVSRAWASMTFCMSSTSIRSGREQWQQLFNAKYVRNLSASTEAHIAAQITRGSGKFLDRMIEVGGR